MGELVGAAEDADAIDRRRPLSLTPASSCWSSMGRQLRPRKSQPNYAALASLETDDENELSRAGPSTRTKSKPVYVDDGESESDFELQGDEKAENVQESGEEDDEEDNEDDEIDEIDDEDEALVEKKGGKAKSTPLKLRKPTARWKGKESATSTPKTSTKKKSSSTPSIHHRHRAVPLYTPIERVERLTTRPKLFSPPSITLTNGYTTNTKISDRVSKSWGFNVGAGPLWDLAEDRGWYKEAITTGSDTETEAKRRPRVYTLVGVKEGWEILNKKCALVHSAPRFTLIYSEMQLLTCQQTRQRLQREISSHLHLYHATLVP